MHHRNSSQERMFNFHKDLTDLVAKHDIDKISNLPAEVTAGMFCRLLETIRPYIREAQDHMYRVPEKDEAATFYPKYTFPYDRDPEDGQEVVPL